MMHVKVDPFVKTNLYGNIIKGLIFEDFVCADFIKLRALRSVMLYKKHLPLEVTYYVLMIKLFDYYEPSITHLTQLVNIYDISTPVKSSMYFCLQGFLDTSASASMLT